MPNIVIGSNFRETGSGGEDNFLTVYEQVQLKEFEEDNLLMQYVGLTDKDREKRARMEKLDQFLKAQAEIYRKLKAKAEKISKESRKS